MKKEKKLLKLLNSLMYGRIGRENYHLHKEEVNINNQRRLEVFSLANFIFNFMIFITSFTLKIISHVTYIYLLISMFSLIIYIINKSIIKKKIKHITIIYYIFITILFLSYTIIGINQNSNNTASAICGMYILFPIFFADIPLRYGLFINTLTALLCTNTIITKSPYYANLDCLNCITFSIVSTILSYYFFYNRITDVIARKILKIERDTDYLTNLSNRIAAENIISQYLSISNSLSVMFVIDLDNFKYVNDTYGHSTGDQVLINMANILRKTFRKNDCISRIGGDEFVIFVKNIPNKSWAIEKSNTIIDLVNTSILPNEEKIVSCSIGIAYSSNGQNNYQMLFKKADKAMYEAKKSGKNCYFIYKEKN